MCKKYTPISAVNQKGKVTFIIKIYRENKNYPGGGVFTQYLENKIRVGDNVLVEGPFGKLSYHGMGGEFRLLGKKMFKKKLMMLGAGTGITPLFSIAQASVKSKDNLSINLIYSNKTIGDILCKD